MQRKFIVNLFILIGINLIVKPFWIFGIDRSVQNAVGEQAYGLYFAIFNFTIIFNCLLDCGINNFNNKSIAESNSFLQKNFARIFSLKLLLAVAYIVVVLIAGLVAGYRGFAFFLLVGMGINQFLSCFILYLRSNISGLLKFKTDSLLSVTDRVIMIVICGILLWGNVTKQNFQIQWFVYAQFFAYLATIAIALPIVLRQTGLKPPFWDFTFFKKTLLQSIPFALLALLTNLHNRSDAVLLERMLPDGIGDAQSGIYASAFRMLDAANMIAVLFAVILLPLFANMISKNEKINTIVKTSFVFILIYSVPIAIGSWFYSSEIMELLYHHRVEESATVFKFLMLSLVPLTATYIFGSLLTAKGELKKLNVIALCAVAINVGLNGILILPYQANGSAVASLCTQVFIIVAELILAKRIFGFPFSWIRFTKTGLFILLSFAAIFVSTKLNFDWKINLLLGISGSVLAVFVVKLIDFNDIKTFLRKN